jgi:hypothetical protein
VEKDIAERVASWNWENDLEEPPPGTNKKNVAMGTKTTVNATACFASLQDMVGKHFENAIDLEVIKATTKEIIFKNKARGPEVSGKVEN